MERWTGQAAGTRAAGVAVDRRRQHRPQLLPRRRRPQRRPDAGQLAGLGRHPQPAARHAAAGRPAVRPDRHHAGLHRRAGQRRRSRESILYDVGRYEVRNMIMASPGAVAPVVYGGKIRAVHGLPRPREDAGARPVAARRDERASTTTTSSCRPATPSSATLDYALDSNSMYELVERHGRHPAAGPSTGNAVFLRDVADAQGRQLHPDQRRARQRPAAGLHPRLPPARRQHARAWSTTCRTPLPDMKSKLTHGRTST